MISDYYTSKERSIAIALYSLGTAAGLPGILLAILVITTVKEPVRGGLDKAAGHAPDMENVQLPVKETLRELWQQKIYVYVTIGHVMGFFSIMPLSVGCRRYSCEPMG